MNAYCLVLYCLLPPASCSCSCLLPTAYCLLPGATAAIWITVRSMVRIAIIGGGIGGLSTAIALRRYGFESAVFEQAPALLDLGAAIALWPNAMRAFQHLGIADKILDASGVMNEIRWLTHDGKILNQVRIDNSQTPAVAVHRADLQRILLETVPSSAITLAHSLLRRDEANDVTTATFSNGNLITCQFLIGADGIHSDVRNDLVDQDGPKFRGYIVWRGISASAPKSLPYDAAIELYGMGKRFGIGPVGHGRVGWWASANTTTAAGSATDLIQSEETAQDELLELFQGWYEPVLHLIQATSTTAVLRTEASDRAASTTWGMGSTTLLGDAIHPTTPNLGQGGCMAIEDAVVLARCFEKYGATEASLRAYERVRHSRTAAITGLSRMYGQIGQWESRYATGLRGKVISMIPQVAIRRLMKIVFDYDASTVRI
jgi:2-polyprenyl-6-methoxyphenol hydroxylase-like FAD-dependent oxidoreductase